MTGATGGSTRVVEADVAIVGAGAAGLSLAHRLSDPAPGGARPSVVLLEAPPGPLQPPPRTWCSWQAGPGRWEEAVAASWRRLRVRDRNGSATALATGPLRYTMIRSRDFEALAGRDLARRGGVLRLEATVGQVCDAPGGAEARAVTRDGAPLAVRARWLFDTRPPPAPPPARTTLLQHFHGWFLTTREPAFDPATVELMDFRTPQPPRGLSFGYVLPTGPRTALVEYTEFSARPLEPQAYEAALRHYAENVLGLGERHITGTETGAIPMTDGRLAPRAGRSVFRLGTAGGATRPATGYTFAAVQRQAGAVAAALRAGRRPVPPPAYPARARAMDAVLLRALATGRVEGAAFFPRLFREVPAGRLLRFLDGRTRPHEDLAVGLRTPVGPMLRTAAELPLLRRRPAAGPWPRASRPAPPPARPPAAPATAPADQADHAATVPTAPSDEE
ncbi:lycopene cyclase family protein [Streptomyces sp. DSM 44917]|uniref:Lycopene cyclase family protein n=1 Tax=Streptomyces boetiae TaxID=3075541 RepID=A0ABU2LCD7_9ACTN|nr:lycopene cyclase family protein [Streptomyces sp. DSM 44917]MDT0309244.1 lycopene cyclase family protein [Streptomyces sp. DSM 44917]